MFVALLIIIAIGVILEILSLKRSTSKFDVDCSVSVAVTEPGEPFKVRTIVTNNSMLPISYLAVREAFPSVASLPEGMSFTEEKDELHGKRIFRLSSRERSRQTINVNINRRGVYNIKGKTFEIGDFLGFRELSKRIGYEHEIVVYPDRPKCPELSEVLGGFFGDVSAKRFLIRDPILAIGIREYTGREPMKEIHWLQSAHRGGLMVKEFDFNRQLSVCVLLSVEGVEPFWEERLDESCSLARVVCEVMVEAGANVSFCSNARLKGKKSEKQWKFEVTHGTAPNLLEGLGRVTSLNCGTLEGLLDFALRKNRTDTAYIVILPEKDARREYAEMRLRANTNQEVLVLLAAERGTQRSDA